jgi:hypothetical protein
MSLALVAELEAIGDDPEKFSAFLSVLLKKRARASFSSARAPHHMNQFSIYELSSHEAARHDF